VSTSRIALQWRRHIQLRPIPWHGAVEFRKGYQDRRVNVTLLFGERQNAAYRFDMRCSGTER